METTACHHATTIGGNVILPFENTGTVYHIEDITPLPTKPFYNVTKRLLDIVVSVVDIVLLSPILLLLYICVATTSKGKPIYKQERLGLNGKKFHIYKFRSMYEDAEKNGAQWSMGDADDRVTPVGRFLRKTKLDELPQLFNCLCGDLSLVGPRPERAVFYDCFETYIHGFSQRLFVKPGITGLAQINGYLLKPEEKVQYDIEYIKKRSLWLDLKILFKTAAILFRKSAG